MNEVMVNNVKLQAPGTPDGVILMFLERYTAEACAITRYKTPPKWLEPYIEDAAVKAIGKMGAEAFDSQSAGGVSTSYIDVTESLKKALKGKINPLGAVYESER